MNSIIKEMLKRYNCNTKEDYINAFKEIVQEIALYALSQTDFFDHAAFYGGTALRIFYGLDRFSEDLDFSLVEKNEKFTLEKYFVDLKNTFDIFGLKFEPQLKKKSKESNVQSAFLKGNTLEHMLLINPMDDIVEHIQKEETIRIKFEVDINPPAGATYEYRYGDLPLPYRVKVYDQASLFAGKLHAVLFRNWRNRVKGRDFYDLDFYIRTGCLLNVNHLEKRINQSQNVLQENLTLGKVKKLLIQKINDVDFDAAKKDVIPFVYNLERLKFWGKEYFKEKINRIEENKFCIYKNTYDLRRADANEHLLNSKILASFNVNDVKRRSEIRKEINQRFFNYTISSDDLLNFGDNKNLEITAYIIEGLGEQIYLDGKIDENDLIKILNSIVYF